MGEVYNYYPGAVYDDAGYCATGPMSVCDKVYGDSSGLLSSWDMRDIADGNIVGRGAFTFPTGEWVTLSQRLKLNDVGSSNGEQELFVNGVSTINLSGLEISVESDTKIYGIMAQTFFVGSIATCTRTQLIHVLGRQRRIVGISCGSECLLQGLVVGCACIVGDGLVLAVGTFVRDLGYRCADTFSMQACPMARCF